jgi:hypothetical protein
MVLTLLERLALRRRRAGASPIWTAAAFAAWMLRRYQRNASRDNVVLREELKPGQSLVITHTTQPHG